MTQIQSLDYKVPTVKEAKKTKVDNVEYDKLIEMFVLNWGALERKNKGTEKKILKMEKRCQQSPFLILNSLTYNVLNVNNRAAVSGAWIQSILQCLLWIRLVGLLLGNFISFLPNPLFERCPALWLKSGMFELVLIQKTLIWMRRNNLTGLTKSRRTMSAFGQIFVCAVAKTRVFPLTSLT